MVGTSRKSFIGHYLDAQVNDRMEGSLATAVAAVMRGASLIRCHDVRETVRAVRMAGLVRNSTDNGIGK
jgi:dihydropteroate synthase